MGATSSLVRICRPGGLAEDIFSEDHNIEQEPLFFTGKRPVLSDGAQYTIMIRASDDPERLTREQRRALRGPKVATEWRRGILSLPIPEWKSMITNGLGTPGKTFNRLVLELTEYEYTADVAGSKNPEKALWELVDAGIVEHTMVAPILFRMVTQPCSQSRSNA